MFKLLVNAPPGTQEVIEVGEGGGYFDAERVLWDERVDGALPEITLGAMVRQGDSLVVSPDRLAESHAAGAAEAVAAKLIQINAARAAVLAAGAPYEFDGVADVIQTRPQDQTNLLCIWTAAMEANAAGITDPLIEFRAASDTSYWLTPQDALAMTAAARAYGQAAYKASWDRKNALAAINLNAPDALELIAAV